MGLDFFKTALEELAKASPYAAILVLVFVYVFLINRTANKRVDTAYHENLERFDKILESSSKDLRENIKALQEQNRNLLESQSRHDVSLNEIPLKKDKKK